MKNKSILVGITGSIAAYKAAELVSQLKQLQANIYVIMTKNAMEFVGPATFRSLTGSPVFYEMFPKEELFVKNYNNIDSNMHIKLAEWPDVLVIAPATANIIGKIANGIADDLLSTVILSTKKPLIIAPAMNEKMYLNVAVQENLKILKKRGIHIIEPETGFLACGYEGKGRLASVLKIIDEIRKVIK